MKNIILLKNKAFLACTLLVILILFLNIDTFAKPYGLRETEEIVEFNGSLEFNYLFVDHQSFVQFIFIPELTFGTINLGFGLYAPLSIDNDFNIRTVHYNSVYGLLGLIYYLQYGFFDKENNPFAFRVSEIKDFTLGSGFIIKHYYNNLFFPEMRKLGLRVQFDKWGVKLDALIGDLINQSVTGGRFALNIGELATTKLPIIETLELGFSFVSEINSQTNNIVKIYNAVEHEIVSKKYSNNNFLYVMGADISFDFFKNKIISFALFSDFATMDTGGQGVGYGISSWVKSDDYDFRFNYKVQVNHSFNYFIPSYFNSLYDFTKSYKASNIKTGEKDRIGLNFGLGFYFFDKQISFIVEYEDFFGDNKNPHLLFLLKVNNVPKGLFIIILYDFYNIASDSFNNMTKKDNQVFIEFAYAFTPFSEFGFSFQKNFIIAEKNSIISSDTLLTIIVFSRFLF